MNLSCQERCTFSKLLNSGDFSTHFKAKGEKLLYNRFYSSLRKQPTFYSVNSPWHELIFLLSYTSHACCAYAYKNFSCMISIINRITAYVYYLLQNLLVCWRFLIEFKNEHERTTILLTYIQSCPLLTSYICHNFRYQQRMCH